MATTVIRACFTLLILFLAIFVFPPPIQCDEEDDVFQGINSYRTRNNLPQLSKHKKATCVAESIADKIQDNACPASSGAAKPIQAESYPEVLDKCGVSVNHTSDGVILPVCVRKLVPTLVLSNYTDTQNEKYLNDTRFSGAGLASEDDWMVLVLTTDSPEGTFAAAHRLLPPLAFGHCLAIFTLGIVVYLLC